MPPYPPVVVEASYYGGSEWREEYNPFEKKIMDHVGPEVGQFIDEEVIKRFQKFEEG